MSGRFRFLSRNNGQSGRKIGGLKSSIFYDTSSRSFFGQYLSPFSTKGVLKPVPGNQDFYSKSVEGIWQGLKIIDQKTDYSLFESEKPKKRKFEPYSETKFKYNCQEIGLIEARKKIFMPAYKFMLDIVVPQALIENIMRTYHAGVNQYFYDVDDNRDIDDATRSYSHSSLLVELLDEKVNDYSEYDISSLIKGIEKYDCYDSEIYRITTELEDFFESSVYIPSVINFGTQFHYILNKHVEDKENREHVFLKIIESYSNRLGYTFAPSINKKSFKQIFTDSNIKSKGVRKILMRHVKIKEE